MKTKRLTESAMLLALAIVLELISKAIIPEMPFGGQVTLVAMLPVVLISYRYGVKWGFVSGFCYALLEMALGAKTVSAAFQPGYFGDDTMIFKAILMCLLDYLLAYTMMGLGGIFRDKIKNPGTSLMCGSLVALGARYLSHILSGYLLFSGWAEWFFTQDGFPAWGAKLVESLSPVALGWVYSIVYNGFYMVPELILTAIAAQLKHIASSMSIARNFFMIVFSLSLIVRGVILREGVRFRRHAQRRCRSNARQSRAR